MISDLMDFQEHLRKEGIVLCFQGPINQGTTEKLGDTLRAQLNLTDPASQAHIRVFSAFVEMAQNVSRYSREKWYNDNLDSEGTIIARPVDKPPSPLGDSHQSLGIIVIGHENGHFYIQCGNLIRASDQPPLAQHLDALRNMDPEELKAFYRQRRRAPPPATSKGAGLGLIQLARHSHAMEYHFRPVSPSTLFFTLTVFV